MLTRPQYPLALVLFLAAILTAVAQDEIPAPDAIVPLSDEQVLFYYKGPPHQNLWVNSGSGSLPRA
ncbi:MAG: hypothetical protein FWC43_07950 [Planctomycetaceae bacterium]|nr:hypothetical protein [Planctomycetaceae bacterium]